MIYIKIVICLILMLGISIAECYSQSEDNFKQLKASNKNDRKEERLSKRNRRVSHRRIIDVVYDFEHGKFACDRSEHHESKTHPSCPPPYEIHEMDGVRLRIKNVNPFLYKVNLYEFQGDQINNESLMDGNLNYTLSLDFEMLKTISLNRIGLYTTTDDPMIDMKIEKKSSLQETIHNLSNLEVDQVNDSLKSAIDFEIDSKKQDLITLNYEINNLKEWSQLKAKEMTLQDGLKQIQTDINKINLLVKGHNQMIYLVCMPIYNATDLRKEFDKMFDEYETFGNRYFKIQQNVHELINDNIILVKELKHLDDKLNNTGRESVSKRDIYDNIESTLRLLGESMKSLNFEKLLSQIMFIKKMLTDENFCVVYETYSIAENADYLKYKIEFIPNTLNGLMPQSVDNEYLNIEFKIREGFKLDLSSGFVLDIGLSDPAYYYDRTTDASGDKIFIRKSTENSNVSPSIAAFLNGYKRASTNLKVGGAMGIGLSNNARFRLYLGPSFIIGRKERIIFSSGVSFGATSRLADGYSTNMQLDNSNSLPPEVPTKVDDFKFGSFFGIGFNLTGQKNKSFLESVKFQ